MLRITVEHRVACLAPQVSKVETLTKVSSIAQQSNLFEPTIRVMRKKVSSAGTTMQDVERLLNNLCGMPPAKCPNCGVEMAHMSVTFFTSENDKSWTAPLPICVACAPTASSATAAA